MNRGILADLIDEDTIKGEKLAGDDLNHLEIQVWYEQEKEGFSSYLQSDSESEECFSFYLRVLDNAVKKYASGKKIRNFCVLGPGEGREVELLLKLFPTSTVYLIEPSDRLREVLSRKFGGAEIFQPFRDGTITLGDNSIDLFVAMGVLHHIPNVSFVLREIYRVLSPAGVFYNREPCAAMGDWSSRVKLTPNERGISKKWMTSALNEIGFFLIEKPRALGWDPLLKIVARLKCHRLYSSSMFLFLDFSVSKLLSINDHYWRDRYYKKIGPSSYHYILKKGENSEPVS